MKSFNNIKPLTYNEMLDIENEIYEEQIIKDEVEPEKIITEDIMKRKLETFCDKTFNFPQHIFLIDNYKGNILVGRKIKSVLSIENKINAFHCSMITSSMLLGFLYKKEENGKDVKVEYYPFTKGEKITIFNEIKHNKMINLYYPFKYRHFETNEEEKSPSTGWSLNPEKVVYLGYGEEHIRNYTIAFLKNIVKPDMTIYDPACSTGQFLNNIKKAYPFVKTIGQDLSKEMCNYAKDYVDEIYCGDSIDSPIKDNSIDIMFLRFLNSEVVTTEYAYELFDNLIKKVKTNGKIVAFGHTALLIDDSYFKKCGLKVEQRIAYDENYDAIFQYYVLEKEMYNPNELSINRENIKFNLDSIKQHIGEKTDIMPIIKANAYGIGVDNILNIIKEKQITQVGVATVEEAVNIRRKYDGMILVLLQPFKEQIEDILINEIVTNVSDIDFLIELNKIAKSKNIIAKVHVEINTGMGRTGIQLDEIPKFLDKLKELKHISVEGVSTHFSTAKDEYYTKEQINKFNYAISKLKEEIKSIKYIHACSSSSILNYPQAHFNLVRIGIMMYGYYNDKRINLKPCLELKTHISYIHNVKKGEAIGYNKTTIAKKDMRVAIIPIGFADAFMGLESNIAYTLVNNQKATIIAICMDSMIIDITNIKQVNTNAEVILWDNKNITLEQWGEWTKTSTYEVLSILSNRIKRKIT